MHMRSELAKAKPADHDLNIRTSCTRRANGKAQRPGVPAQSLSRPCKSSDVASKHVESAHLHERERTSTAQMGLICDRQAVGDCRQGDRAALAP
jgi:hypothetical protein